MGGPPGCRSLSHAGTFADVFLVREPATDQKYAVKRLNADEDRRATVENEIAMMVPSVRPHRRRSP